ncbi:uncharacterized protein EDB93DRAFT_1247984 [Suillus bovinus]|uniref:uncharacterized protein n=1 Tax=Suillus bovinus TaxID=48563 RepID=UPI001B875824|nr:uncharacterized protein EDB93DRAFT_1247984 [Suillus bovinus]KAG2155029.1 hypothetical protein EDB93DRAFT_1247984 [Suillus bovinus]
MHLSFKVVLAVVAALTASMANAALAIIAWNDMTQILTSVQHRARLLVHDARPDVLIKRQRTTEPTQSPEDVIANVNPEPIQSSPDTIVGSNPTSPPSLPAPLQENTGATSTGRVDVANDEALIAFTPSDTAVGSNPTSPSSVTPSPA